MASKSEMFRLIKKRGTNQLDDLTMGLVNAMKYSDSDVEYPEFTGVKPGKGVQPEWFYDVYRGTNGFSELTAINQYVSQEALFDDVGELMMGVALVEMKHMDKLGGFILKLKGQVTQEYDTRFVEYGSSAREAVELAVKSETATIAKYEKLTERVEDLPQNDTTKVTLQLLAKLIADEQHHRTMFREWLKTHEKKPDEQRKD